MKTFSRALVVAAILVALGLAALYIKSRHAVLPLSEPVTLVQNQPYHIEVTPNKRIRAGDTVRLFVRVLRDGKVADIYQEGRVVHYILSSANYHDLVHTYGPEVKGPGEFYLDHTFTQPGPYRLWLELVDTTKASKDYHGQNADLLIYYDLVVAGTTATDEGALIEAHAVQLGDYTVTLSHPPLSTGHVSPLRIEVTDDQKKPYPLLPQEPAIYVIVGPDFEFFRHTHAQPATGGTTIEINEAFPTNGEYMLWLEINVPRGEETHILEVPFLLKIPHN